MKNSFFVVLSFALILNQGCASFKALNMDGPKYAENLQVGNHRSLVETTVGTNGRVYKDGEITRANYQYLDGPHPGTKVRAILYLGADIFTLFLSEIIFWPLEMAVEHSSRRSAEALYDEQNKLIYFREWKTGNQKQTVTVGEY